MWDQFNLDIFYVKRYVLQYLSVIVKVGVGKGGLLGEFFVNVVWIEVDKECSKLLFGLSLKKVLLWNWNLYYRKKEKEREINKSTESMLQTIMDKVNEVFYSWYFRSTLHQDCNY